MIDASILVASDAVADADLVAQLLRDEYAKVVCSTEAARAVADFDAHRPSILILAFEKVADSQRYYLGLYRLSTLVHTIPHRTLILCHKDELREAYELCRKEYFDDYVMFWPLNHDARRLPMAVHQGLRQLAVAAPPGEPTVAEFAQQAHRLADTDAVLNRITALGNERIAAAERALRQAQDAVSSRAKDGTNLRISNFNSRQPKAPGDAVADAMKPVRAWAASLQNELGPQLEATRALQGLVRRVPRRVLIVEDDEFQLKLMRQLLQDADCELVEASSGAAALAALPRRRPSIIRLDVGLPDISGVELARRIKNAPVYAGIPIIMITGHSGKEIVMESIKAGAADFAVKPLNRDLLLKKIRACLGEAAAPTDTGDALFDQNGA
jgi:DNA-binding response OmpR family regulator